MYEWIPVAPVVPESKEAKINGVTSESRCRTAMAHDGTLGASTRVTTVTDQHITNIEDREFPVITRVRTGRREEWLG